MLKRHQGAEVDIVDRLPMPYGLVRSGVAPDHPETKIVTNQFSRVAQNERCSFFGNVSLGSSVSLSELREMYHVVVLAYGAESDRVLGIAGEDLAGIHSAREFVWWYNGHPDCKYLAPDLKSTDTAVILGQGNVALDVARILLRPTAELATTDIASHALAALEESSIRKVYLVGRRGPVQAACTTKELREVLGIKGLHINIKEADLVKTPADEEELKNSRIQKRVYELLSKAAVSGPSHRSSDQRELHFVFFRKPDGFLDSDDRSGHVVGVGFEKTILKESVGSGKQVAVGTGQFEDLECRLVLKSIGYRSVPVDDLPFDAHKGIVPNVGGRVLINSSGDHTQLEGVYVCGWLKRGPTGIIATNLYCAEETIMSISEDLEKGVLASAPSLPKPGREGLLQLLDRRNVKVIPFSSWEKIDTEERRLGSLKNKPRDKLTTWEELLKVATKSNSIKAQSRQSPHLTIDLAVRLRRRPSSPFLIHLGPSPSRFFGASSTLPKNNFSGTGGATYCAVASLRLMGFIEDDVLSKGASSSIINVPLLLDWSLQRLAADGGFQGRPNKPSDTCYAFWVGGVLRILGGHKFIDEKALRQFLLTCQSQYGGFSKFPGQLPDLYHSYYGFSAFSMLEEPGVNPICVELGITDVAAIEL